MLYREKTLFNSESKLGLSHQQREKSEVTSEGNMVHQRQKRDVCYSVGNFRDKYAHLAPEEIDLLS